MVIDELQPGQWRDVSKGTQKSVSQWLQIELQQRLLDEINLAGPVYGRSSGYVHMSRWWAEGRSPYEQRKHAYL